MFYDKLLISAFLISTLTHGVIILQDSGISIFLPQIKSNNIEVKYIKPTNKQNLKTPPPQQRSSGVRSRDNQLPPSFIVSREGRAAKEINKNISFPIKSPMGLNKPAILKPEAAAIRKKITLPAVNMDKINNASYISYYQLVREKIRRAAYQNFARTQNGEVFLSFIITKNGDLAETNLVEDKSSADSYLRQIALRSIKEASPFPTFPKELDYPQLSFNVVISFEIE